MKKQQLLMTITDNVRDCSSATLSSPKTVAVKRTVIRKLNNGRFLQSKLYKIRFRNEAFESDVPLSVSIQDINTDDFFAEALAAAETFDEIISDLCITHRCKIKVTYEPDYLTVENLVGTYPGCNLQFSCTMRGKYSYDSFAGELSNILDNTCSSIDKFLEDKLFEVVTAKLYGLDALMEKLNRDLSPAEFTYVISRDSRRVEIMCNGCFIAEAEISEATEFGSALDLYCDIVNRYNDNNKITSVLNEYKEVLKEIGHFNLDYYEWLDSYRVIISSPLIKGRYSRTPIAEFTVTNENLSDLPNLIKIAKDTIINDAPKYGTIIERIENE